VGGQWLRDGPGWNLQVRSSPTLALPHKGRGDYKALRTSVLFLIQPYWAYVLGALGAPCDLPLKPSKKGLLPRDPSPLPHGEHAPGRQHATSLAQSADEPRGKAVSSAQKC
jgi:hypothetical protein